MAAFPVNWRPNRLLQTGIEGRTKGAALKLSANRLLNQNECGNRQLRGRVDLSHARKEVSRENFNSSIHVDFCAADNSRVQRTNEQFWPDNFQSIVSKDRGARAGKASAADRHWRLSTEESRRETKRSRGCQN